MSTVASLAGLAALIAEPARAAMLVTLLDGRALTAGELAEVAGVTPATASGHLARLAQGGLLALERQGRHRYHRLADARIAAMLEGLMALDATLAAVPRRVVATGPRDRALRRLRLCYDHLAGEIAVAMCDALLARGALRFGAEGAVLSDGGVSLLSGLGVDIATCRAAADRRGAALCRPCLDWSERRPHLAGPAGAGLYRALLGHGCLRPDQGTRAVTLTQAGEAALARHLAIGR